MSDHVQVTSWHDTDGGEYSLNDNYGISCIRNNILSFVSYPACANYLVCGIVTYYRCQLLFAVVSQAYSVHLVEENVLRGNAAIIKCLIPSFVTEYVSVSSWIMSEGEVETEIKLNDTMNKEGILYLLRCIQSQIRT